MAIDLDTYGAGWSDEDEDYLRMPARMADPAAGELGRHLGNDSDLREQNRLNAQFEREIAADTRRARELYRFQRINHPVPGGAVIPMPAKSPAPPWAASPAAAKRNVEKVSEATRQLDSIIDGVLRHGINQNTKVSVAVVNPKTLKSVSSITNIPASALQRIPTAAGIAIPPAAVGQGWIQAPQTFKYQYMMSPTPMSPPDSVVKVNSA